LFNFKIGNSINRRLIMSECFTIQLMALSCKSWINHIGTNLHLNININITSFCTASKFLQMEWGYMVNFWNSLPEEVVQAPSVNVCKQRFDKLCERLVTQFGEETDLGSRGWWHQSCDCCEQSTGLEAYKTDNYSTLVP